MPRPCTDPAGGHTRLVLYCPHSVASCLTFSFLHPSIHIFFLFSLTFFLPFILPFKHTFYPLILVFLSFSFVQFLHYVFHTSFHSFASIFLFRFLDSSLRRHFFIPHLFSLHFFRFPHFSFFHVLLPFFSFLHLNSQYLSFLNMQMDK